MMKPLLFVGSALALGGCVAEAPLTVSPGQGKSYSDLQRDDAACRGAPATTTQTTQTTTQSAASTAPNYYQCMAARGELVVANRTTAYPVYAGYPYAYPAYAYGYGFPYYGYGYPYYGYPYYGYPYSAAYVGPYVGLGVGIGFGFGGYRGYGYRGYGYRGYGYRGGHGDGFHGGFHEGFHGGGGRH